MTSPRRLKISAGKEDHKRKTGTSATGESFWPSAGCLKLQTMTQIFLLLSIVMNMMSALKTGEGRVVTMGVGVGVLKAAFL